jgi:hypothetical protein
MSIHCICRVWDHSSQKGRALLLLLAIADGADEYGLACPGLATLAARIRMSRDQTLRLLARLQDAGELLVLPCPGGDHLYLVRSGAGRQTLAAGLDRAASFGAILPAGAVERVPAITAIRPGPAT